MSRNELLAASSLLVLALASGLTVARAAEVKAIVGARIFDGTGGPVLEHGTLLIQDGKITAIGESKKIKPPAGARIIKLEGKTITPGLINAHGHVSDVENQNTGATDERVI